MASEAEQTALQQDATEVRDQYRAVIAETVAKAAGTRAAKAATATVTKTASRPTASERVLAQAVIEAGGDAHEIDKSVLTLLAAGRESEVMSKAAEAERWGLLDRATLQKSANMWRTRMPDTVTAMRELLDASPADRADRVEKAREAAYRETTPDAVRFRLGEVGRLAELIELADRWGHQSALPPAPTVLQKAQTDALIAQVTAKVEAALAPVEARMAKITKMLGSTPGTKGQR